MKEEIRSSYLHDVFVLPPLYPQPISCKHLSVFFQSQVGIESASPFLNLECILHIGHSNPAILQMKMLPDWVSLRVKFELIIQQSQLLSEGFPLKNCVIQFVLTPSDFIDRCIQFLFHLLAPPEKMFPPIPRQCPDFNH